MHRPFLTRVAIQVSSHARLQRCFSFPRMANYTYISAADLVQLIRTEPSSVSIVDVRDDDHVGGHIKGSQWVATSSLDWRLPELVRTLKDRPTVVFHCTLSQVRGPKAARRYGEERERLLGGQGDDSQGSPPKQKVYVLSGGFERWVQDGHGADADLTEAFAKDIWEMSD
jgi:rhodanese-related sulfurtransferase